jgi:hypothetical protein
MSEADLSVSGRARDLAHKIAAREKRTVEEVVETALADYDARTAERRSAAEFYASLRADEGDDVDLMEIINEARKPHRGIDL